MIVTSSKWSATYGDTIDLSSFLAEDYRTVLTQDKYIYVNQADLMPKLRYGMQSGQLIYQIYNPGTDLWSVQIPIAPNSPALLQSQLGQANGVCGLNATSQVDKIYLPINFYQGLFAQMTQTPFYGSNLPQVGCLFNTTDTNQVMILKQADYTVQLNWQTIAVDPSGTVLSVNGQTGDIVLHSNDLTATGTVSFGDQIVTDLALATLAKSAVRLDQMLQNYFLYAYLNTDITSGLTDSYYLPFDEQIVPIGGLSNIISYLDTVVSLPAGIYRAEIKILTKYQGSTQSPISFMLELNGVTLNYTVVQGDTTDSFSIYKSSDDSFVFKCLSASTLRVLIEMESIYVNAIGAGTSLLIQPMQLF